MIESKAGVLPLTPFAHAMVDVDDEMIFKIEQSGADVLIEIAQRTIGALRALAETSGQDVSPECVLVNHAGKGNKRFTQKYVATWAPNHNAKADLHGGPACGTVISVARDSKGWPAPMIRVPAPIRFGTAVLANGTFPPELPEVLTYKLVGFRNDPAVWVYEVTS